MKAAQLRDKSVEDLREELNRLVTDKLKLEIQGRDRQSAQYHRFRSYRRDIARVKTLIRQKTEATS